MFEQELQAFDSEIAATGVGGQQARPWLITFANLICLLLSFFVMLANISKVEHDRVRDALHSLSESLAFGTEGVRTGAGTPPEAEALAGPEVVRERLATRIRGVFPDVRMEEIPARNELRFALPIAAVFYGTDIKPEAKPVLAAVAAAVKRGAPGFRFEAEARAGLGSTQPAIAITEASLLARALVDEGAPKTSVAAGMDHGSPNEIRFTVRARAEDEPRLDFRNLAPQP
ncbi:MAG TPA: flagellar motor protein MotB [Alphaproteobacteria bacterium]|jgi:hypothetical protein|nr:flagellar motor protein MotB [Alphaproteobacteria bacterium]